MIGESFIQEALEAVIAREKGYVDNPADAGGPTKYGITLATLAEWRKGWQKNVTAEDVKALTVQEARDIYRKVYVETPGFRYISDPRLFGFIVDAAANHGPSRATKILQEALQVTTDGVMGPETRNALLNMNGWLVYKRAVAARVRFYGRIISGNRTDADRDGIPDATEFAAGWLNRVAEFIEA